MGLSFATVQRLFLGSFVASLLVYFFQRDTMNAALTLIALSSLTAIIWGLSEKDATFSSLSINAEGFLFVFGFILSIVIFAQLCIGLFEWPFLGSYITSLFFVGSFWWTGAMIQPKTN
tara:strand:- start:6676 stop:7029 length:354 start_codon:yes stop_codon:yes gene_type:complete